jgi:hypothetical protein
MKKAEREALAIKRQAICETAIAACIKAINTAGIEYGSRFKANGAHEAILDAVDERMRKPGRKAKAPTAAT